ncbi:MAG: NAD(P)/FAD-dependent oxidoreductase [Sporichthyaceae bacterium]|nr:NAD(P)/FAD-dependent oxidoreductase [Sporichthyaceae bacterium]
MNRRSSDPDQRPHVLIVGGGYVGLYAAFGLRRAVRRGRCRVTVVDPRSYMTYQPFLPEAAAGSVEPRHVVVALRKVLPHASVLNGRVTKVDHANRTVTVDTKAGDTATLGYDHIVIAAGSVSRTLPIPGLAEHGIGFKYIEEAIGLRNHVLDQLDLAASTADAKRREAALRFVFVGGGYAGVEAMSELEDMARYACRFYRDSAGRPQIDPAEMGWVLVEASERILPEVDEDMGRYTVECLRDRGIDVRLSTRLVSAVDGRIVLDDGLEFPASTLVWTAGVRPSPVVANTDLPLDDRGRVRAQADLEVIGADRAWAAGDCAAVPDLTRPGEFCSPSAQHAVRQARLLAANIDRRLRGKTLKNYRHANVGSVATLGLHKGVAQVYGVKVRGWPAWFMHRTYHVSRMPTLNRKIRIVADWTLALFFRREVVSLGSLHQPRETFREVAGSG